MNERSYAKAVAKRLMCSKARRDEFVRDLEADIASAREAGEPWEQIERRMGDPRQVAAEFNENLSDGERAAGRKRKRVKIIAIAAAIVLVMAGAIGGAAWWAMPHQGPVEQVSGTDETVARAQEAVTYLSEKDYDGLRSLASEDTVGLLTDELLEQTNAAIAGGDWGEFESFGAAYKADVQQMGRSGVVVQIAAFYENVTISFLVAFDEGGKMTGLHVV